MFFGMTFVWIFFGVFRVFFCFILFLSICSSSVYIQSHGSFSSAHTSTERTLYLAFDNESRMMPWMDALSATLQRLKGNFKLKRMASFMRSKFIILSKSDTKFRVISTFCFWGLCACFDFFSPSSFSFQLFNFLIFKSFSFYLPSHSFYVCFYFTLVYAWQTTNSTCP